MDLELTGKFAIVTGSSRGIGASIARTLSAEGVRVMLVARSSDRLETVAAGLQGEHAIEPVDLRAPEAPAIVVATAMKRFGRIDLVVNNAGAAVRGDFLELSDAQWEDGFALKFYGAMRLCRAAWPHLVASHGSIVNIAGVGGRTGSAEFAIGGAVNAAVLNLTKTLADRGIVDGVRVNAINPGGIATERLTSRIQTYAEMNGITIEEAARQMPRKLGIARYGDPEAIARGVAFLASPRSAHCQGTILDIDGGQTRTL